MENYTFYYKTYDELNGIFETQDYTFNNAFKAFLGHLRETGRDMIDYDCDITRVTNEIL